MPSSTIARRTFAASAALLRLFATVLGLIASIFVARALSTSPSVVRRGSSSSRASAEPEPFRPVLRGQLLTGDASLNLRTDVAGGGGEGTASLDRLWWPPHKISGRYLAPKIYHGELHEQGRPPGETLDVEVALPQEWHIEPMALDPLSPPETD
jgi:hypothetical protein